MSNSEKTFVALFTYGGGMRGLVAAHIMAALEERTGLRMADMVDVFAGPSTGAIINAALTRPHPDKPERPLYRARHIVKFYEREGIKIFPPDRFRDFRGILHDFNNRTLKLSQLNWLFRHGHYDPSNLGRALKDLYGDTKLEDSLTSLIIPTYNIDGQQLSIAEERGVSGDSPARTVNNITDEGGHAVWLKHMRHNYPKGAADKTADVYLYDAVMASCAAPTYFPCHHFKASFPERRSRVRMTVSDNMIEKEMSCIDGVIFDNPCISYLGAIRRHVPPDHKLIMIILGTGYTNKSVSKEDWNTYGALGVVDPVNDLPLINIFFHASESALMDSFAEEMGDNLYVFNKSMFDDADSPDAPSPQIDDASPQNLKNLRTFTESILEENSDKFDELCHLLSKRRDSKMTEEDSDDTFTEKTKKLYYMFTGKPGKRKD